MYVPRAAGGALGPGLMVQPCTRYGRRRLKCGERLGLGRAVESSTMSLRCLWTR